MIHRRWIELSPAAHDTFYVHEVTEERLTKAMAALQAATTRLTPEQAMSAFWELGYGELAVFDPDGKLALNLTDLQIVAVTAAVVAAAETNGRMIENTP
jgi:hypothetical protein